jgi:hypothetical protein
LGDVDANFLPDNGDDPSRWNGLVVVVFCTVGLCGSLQTSVMRAVLISSRSDEERRNLGELRSIRLLASAVVNFLSVCSKFSPDDNLLLLVRWTRGRWSAGLASEQVADG